MRIKRPQKKKKNSELIIIYYRTRNFQYSCASDFYFKYAFKKKNTTIGHGDSRIADVKDRDGTEVLQYTRGMVESGGGNENSYGKICEEKIK